MNDRELLELAAKAAGIEFNEKRTQYPSPALYCGARGWWNPLADDGDALRLLARLPFCEFWISDIGCTVFLPRKPPGHVNLKCDEYAEEHGGDLQAATRRAVVRAAAEIGKSL